MMQGGRILLEIGNSTVKAARVGTDGSIVVERYEGLARIAERFDLAECEIICAPVSASSREEVERRLGGKGADLRFIERADLAPFIGDSYDTPETLGLDRVLNLLGMRGDGLAVSCGTAITIDAVAGGRPYWGAIMPGFRTSAGGLHDRVPVLPLVSPDDETGLPARTSARSVANGVLLGVAGGARGIALELASIAFGGAPHRLVLTGGDAELMHRLWHGTDTEIDDALLFRGMMKVVAMAHI